MEGIECRGEVGDRDKNRSGFFARHPIGMPLLKTRYQVTQLSLGPLFLLILAFRFGKPSLG